MQLVSIFQRLSRIYGGFVWKTINWFSLKIKQQTKSSLCHKYFGCTVTIVTNVQNTKIKIRKMYLFLQPSFFSQDGGGGGGGRHPQLFPQQNSFEYFSKIHGFLQRVGL